LQSGGTKFFKNKYFPYSYMEAVEKRPGPDNKRNNTVLGLEKEGKSVRLLMIYISSMFTVLEAVCFTC
jgi:hypothetical protein